VVFDNFFGRRKEAFAASVEKPFDRLAQITQEVPTIGHLYGVGGAQPDP
jgi:hypothetical protein